MSNRLYVSVNSTLIVVIVGPGNILTVADDLLKNDGQKFLEMMEQLAERRMQREEEAAADVEDDSDDEDGDADGDDDDDGDDGGDGDDDDEEDDEEDDEDDEEDEEVWFFSVPRFWILFNGRIRLGYDRRAKNGRRQTNVLHLCRSDVRTTRLAGISRKGRSGKTAAVA